MKMVDVGQLWHSGVVSYAQSRIIMGMSLDGMSLLWWLLSALIKYQSAARSICVIV
jgi:hypothetical protein